MVTTTCTVAMEKKREKKKTIIYRRIRALSTETCESFDYNAKSQYCCTYIVLYNVGRSKIKK